VKDPTRSIGDVLKDILEDVQQIVRAEVRLARAEVRQELGKAKSAALLLIIASAALMLAAGLLLLAAVFALATVWPPWAAALTVGAAVALLGGWLGSAGLRRARAVRVTPKKTIDSMKENIQWAKTQT